MDLVAARSAGRGWRRALYRGPSRGRYADERFSAFATQLSVSPDGRYVAFIADENARGRSLWVRALGSLSAQKLDRTDNAIFPFWSPDSQTIAFFADGKLKRIPVSGGSPLVICDAPNPEWRNLESRGSHRLCSRNDRPAASRAGRRRRLCARHHARQNSAGNRAQLAPVSAGRAALSVLGARRQRRDLRAIAGIEPEDLLARDSRPGGLRVRIPSVPSRQHVARAAPGPQESPAGRRASLRSRGHPVGRSQRTQRFRSIGKRRAGLPFRRQRRHCAVVLVHAGGETGGYRAAGWRLWPDRAFPRRQASGSGAAARAAPVAAAATCGCSTYPPEYSPA